MTKRRIRHARGLLWLAFGSHIEQPLRKRPVRGWQVNGTIVADGVLNQWLDLRYVTRGTNTLRLTDKGWSVLKRTRLLT